MWKPRKTQLSSSNQTWQWKIPHLQMMFILNLHLVDVPLPRLITGGYIYEMDRTGIAQGGSRAEMGIGEFEAEFHQLHW